MTSNPPGNGLARRAHATSDAPEREPANGLRRIPPVRSPAQLISVVPYLLGFRPADGDMVVIGTAPPRDRVQLALRWDLPGPGDPALANARARRAVSVLAVNGCTQVAVIGFGPEQRVKLSAGLVRVAAVVAGLRVWDVLRADGGRYWSYSCTDPACCPSEGTPATYDATPLTPKERLPCSLHAP